MKTKKIRKIINEAIGFIHLMSDDTVSAKEGKRVIKRLQKVKFCNLHFVSHLFGERYPMCKEQPVQLDCRETECQYHKNGECNNVAPAITLHKGKFTCWTKDSELNCG